ncbi:MAG: hypothetical protein CMM00_00795 [Rhodopirellula sp.]|nr:hypothetical protein [Rhodopirellula sp.]
MYFAFIFRFDGSEIGWFSKVRSFLGDRVEFARTQANLVVRSRLELQDGRRWAVPLKSRPRKLKGQSTERAKE